MSLKEKLDIIIKLLTIVGMVGLGCVFVYMLTLGLRPSEVDLGPIVYQVPTSFPQTPFAIPEDVPTSTSQPLGPRLESLGVVQVFGNSNQGTQIQISKTGIYRFSYNSGAYAVYPISEEGSGSKIWLTSVLVFEGNRALWDGRTIRDRDALLKLFDTKYWDKAENAGNSAKGQYLEIQLAEGTILTLVAVDHLDSYNDNPGQVFVDIYFVEY